MIVDKLEAKLNVRGDRVTWTLTNEKREEILVKLNALAAAGKPAHQYVDVSGDLSTLVLSKNEYV